jgi:hypothetical protein
MKDNGNDMRFSRSTFPLAFRDAVHDIYGIRYNFKAAKWNNWCTLFSPGLLDGRLNDHYYKQWTCFVRAITMATDYSITTAQLVELHATFIHFLYHYEQDYY